MYLIHVDLWQRLGNVGAGGRMCAWCMLHRTRYLVRELFLMQVIFIVDMGGGRCIVWSFNRAAAHCTESTMSHQAELIAAMRYINKALAKGYSISVNDGEEWTVKRSTDAKVIRAALQSTDSDIIRMRNGAGETIGIIYFVWGNSPDEVVCDYSDNELTNEIVGSNNS
jgi:hypothetical protein